MDTTEVVKLAEDTENEQTFSQNAQDFSDVASVSSAEGELECTVIEEHDETKEMEDIPPTPPNRTPTKRKQTSPYVPTPILKKPRPTSIPTTIVGMLMTLTGIRLDSYGPMYKKYESTVTNGKMDRVTLQRLFMILSVVGQIAQTSPGHTYLQRYLSQDLAKELSMTSLSAAQKKKLIGWLREFTTPAVDHTLTKSTESVDSHWPASMLPSPTRVASTISTSCTTADGRSVHVAAQRSAISRDRPSFVEHPVVPEFYRPRTSGTFRSMSWIDQKYKYSVRSPGIEGDYALKLEIYDWKKIAGVPAQDWWKHSECRCFVPVRNKSPTMKAAIQLQESLKQLLESQEDAEGDYIQLRSSD